MSILSKIFNDNKVKRTEVIVDPIKTNYFMSVNTDDYKEELEDFILILQQIQDINNTKAKGQGGTLKNYTQRKNAIDNATNLAIEKYTKKIEELDTAISKTS